MPRGSRPRPWRASVRACVAGALVLAGCLKRHELRPALEAREVGEDFVFESAEARDAHPNRYSYEVEDAAFGPLPRIVLEPRIRLEITDNLDLDDSVEDTESHALTRVRVVVDSGWTHESFNYLVELEDSQDLFEDLSSEEDSIDFRQAYVLMGGKRAIWGVKLGRQEIDLGTGMLAGADWHDNLDPAFDGVRLVLTDRWSRFEPRQWSWRADVLAAKPVRVEGGLNTDHEDYGLAGAFYSDRRAHPFRFDGLVVVTRSDRADFAGELGPTGREVITTLGGAVSAERFGRAGGVSVEVEAAVQLGRRADDQHLATMASAEASYVFPTPWQVRVRGSFAFASGDDDPTDGESGTFQPPFPGDLRDRLGLLGLVGLRNAVVLGIGVSFGPVENFRVGGDIRWLGLEDVPAGWFDARGQTAGAAPTGRSLGREVDVSGRYRFTTKSGKEGWVEGGYAVFEPGDLPVGTGAVQGLYLQTTFRF